MPEVVRRLLAGQAGAWDAFLELYSPLILQVTRLMERDEDRAADSFLFVCQGLRRDGHRRLRGFKEGGAASFATWLRVVVRNLALDWRRSRFGRRTVPAAVTELDPVERELYLLLNHRGLTVDEALGALECLYPRLELRDFLSALDRLHRSVPPAGANALRLVSVPAAEGAESNVPEGRPDPEEVAAVRERRERLASALARLPADERLLVRLRYEAELTLAEVAERTGLSGPQAADRRVRKALDRLRGVLEPEAESEPGESV